MAERSCAVGWVPRSLDRAPRADALPPPAQLVTVGAGAVTLYFSSGKGKTELANNLEAPPSPFKVQK